MRTTKAIDDEFLKKARSLTGESETNALMHENLRSDIERESARRLARLGGSETTASFAPRRRLKTR